jgi:CDP-diacylglycerol--glycerol-3-phosphate 3-phosphatidyltransferase
VSRDKVKMNLPNKLTLSRIILTVAFLFLLFAHGVVCKILALIVFTFAAFTDYLDGHIAKKHGLISDFGKFMDPIADKILTLSAFLAFVEMGLVAAWMVMIIIFREFVITGIRLMALHKDRLIEATLAGKHKTASQMTAIFTILTFIILREIGYSLEFWTPNFQHGFEIAISCLMFVTVLLTVISGVSFFIRNKDILERG